MKDSKFLYSMADFSNENYEKFSHKAGQTDLEKLSSLLDNFLITYSLEKWPSGGTDLSIHDSLAFVFDKDGEFTSLEAL